MIVLVWLALGLLAVVGVAAGRLDVALLCAGAKALLVGMEFMELRHAARLHAVVFVIWVLAITGLLMLAR